MLNHPKQLVAEKEKTKVVEQLRGEVERESHGVGSAEEKRNETDRFVSPSSTIGTGVNNFDKLSQSTSSFIFLLL